jgi:HAD superfamily hydrolase (TIGR01509 family)
MQRWLSGVSAIVFDVDGTLIDSNRAHAEAWAEALTEHGLPHEMDHIRPFIGMGSDKLLPKVARLDVDSAQGKAILARKKTLFDARLPLLQPTRGARALLTFLREQGKTLMVATSADDEEMQAILEQARVGDLIPRRTSSDDAGRSKPDPDIVQAALARSRTAPASAVMVGDTPYDIEAARRAGVDCVAVRCGGWWQDRDLAGAMSIADDPQDLLEQWRT